MKEKMFAGYPEVVNVAQLREMLGGVGYKAAYGLLYDGSIVVLAKSSRAAQWCLEST